MKYQFGTELEFEKALIKRLMKKGWIEVLKYKTEADLIKNWANIIFKNNSGIDRLNDVRLSDSEMDQIITKIKEEKTPYNLHSFINGETVIIKRDNPLDSIHLGKEVALTIFERKAISGGNSVYQIAEQPKFNKQDEIHPDRRGDFMLLINGMPLIHVELKNEGHYISEAVNQIEKYVHEGIFSGGIFSLIQIFVAMKPSETVYFANPGESGQFLKEYQFHWCDFNNEILNDWESIAEHLLAIPMAHMMIGLYTVADASDNVLKVLRSYQYYAVAAIYKRVIEEFKGEKDRIDIKGGYIWHTTGSGKTLTSYKAAQLISDSDEADKVIFLVDRIYLGTESLDKYKGFAEDEDSVSGTENTNVLYSKLKTSKLDDKLIVTSIQKLDILAKQIKNNEIDSSRIFKKRIVIVVDECHRSTFGDMMTNIKNVFDNALYFGFTGTPIQDENAKKGCNTPDIFGRELHRYTIADGIRDGNVLGFDPELIFTFKEDELREEIALAKANAKNIEEVMASPEKKKIYLEFRKHRKMVDTIENGKVIEGIESLIPKSQYTESTQKHKKAVVEHILNNFSVISSFRKFHGLFATSSINDAIEYYRLFKTYMKDKKYPEINITAIFDPHFDNCDGCIYKEDGLIEILKDYNTKFGKSQNYDISTANVFKRDVCKRIAHLEPYKGLEFDKDKANTIDLVIVVDQLLTGFDSKWINVLYLDKYLDNERIIQAFSRTNRIFNKTEKPHGIIKIYRKPFTMEKEMHNAIKLYSGENPFGVFVDKLEKNLNKSNAQFLEIKNIFLSCDHPDFSSTDNFDTESKSKFVKEFNIFNQLVSTCKIQGMKWDKDDYDFQDETSKRSLRRNYSEADYLSLLQRYKELLIYTVGNDYEIPPFDIDQAIIAIPTDTIDSQFMQSKFIKWLKVFNSGENEKNALDDLHNSFSTLTKEEQQMAQIIINDIHNGDLRIEKDKTFRNYINDYIYKFKNKQIQDLSIILGIDTGKLEEFMKEINLSKLNEFGKFDSLKQLVDKNTFRNYLEKKHNRKFNDFELTLKIHQILRGFLVQKNFDINKY